MVVMAIGTVCFGIVVGWVTYRTLRRLEGNAAISDIAAVIGAVGGGAVTDLFGGGQQFGWYSIGLFFGFFLYFGIGLHVDKKNANRKANAWVLE